MKKYLITVNQNQYEVEVVELRPSAAGTSIPVQKPARTVPHAAPVKTGNQPSSAAASKVTAPMPGNVIKIFVAPGDQVKTGQRLLIFEAMKMENDLLSPVDGTISEVRIKEGSVISVEELLMVIE